MWLRYLSKCGIIYLVPDFTAEIRLAGVPQWLGRNSMAEPKKVPDIVVGRLPLYLRTLEFLQQEGISVTSSTDLGARLNISAAQIRKDLSHFGEFGKQGMGYRVGFLHDQLRSILHLDREWQIALVGAGDLGHALVHYDELLGQGFRIACVFDNDAGKIGKMLRGLEIRHVMTLPEVVSSLGIRIGIVAVPVAQAQSVVDSLVGAGAKAILSYAPITVAVPEDVRVQYIDPVAHLQHMTYYL
jgi:redox-sensing transcriptional repressor